MAVPYINPITSTPVHRTVNGFDLEGRIWNVRPHQISDTDVSGSADAYRARNGYNDKIVPIEAYLGIPYAEQPVGARRFKPALMKLPDRNMVCTTHGPIAPQGYFPEGTPHTVRNEWGGRGSVDYASYGSREAEDCLTLNVYVPTTPAPVGGWPVFVFFHGGGSNFLSASTLQLLPHRAVVEGILFVTVEYRLATLGHWYHPTMEAEAGYNGVNFSLTDALASLEWVQSCIGSFGGNASKVTIGGSSAGGNMCSNLLLHPYGKTLFHRAWLSSASAGINTRWSTATTSFTWGYQNWHAIRHNAISAISDNLRDSQNNSRSLAAAITEKGFLPAVRENMSMTDFMALDGGGKDFTGPEIFLWETGRSYAAGKYVVYEDNLYLVAVTHTSTIFEDDLAAEKIVQSARAPLREGRSLTIMHDGYTCLWPTNRAAAVAQAFPATHQVIVIAGQQESTVIGLGVKSFSWDRELFELSTESYNEWLNGPIVNREHNGVIGATWSDYELKRQIFNFGYQHTAKRVAQAVTEVGGSAWLVYGNYKLRQAPSVWCGHGWDISYIFGTINYLVADTKLNADDVFVADGLIRALRNFCHNGNPNTDPGLTGAGLDLFATPWPYAFSQYALADRNWNVVGSIPWRSSQTSTPDMTTRNHFWGHVWTHIEGLTE